MPGKNVKVKISGTQISPEGEVTRTKTLADGTLFEKNGNMFLLYSEKDEDGVLTKTVVKYNKDKAKITRSGQITSTLTFEEKQHFRSSYITPWGSFPVDIDTDRYVLQEQADGTFLSVRYDLAVEGEHCARCIIEMEIEHHGD